MDRLTVNSAIGLSVRLLRLPFVRLFAFLVCSVVPLFAQFFFLFIGINML